MLNLVVNNKHLPDFDMNTYWELNATTKSQEQKIQRLIEEKNRLQSEIADLKIKLKTARYFDESKYYNWNVLVDHQEALGRKFFKELKLGDEPHPWMNSPLSHFLTFLDLIERHDLCFVSYHFCIRLYFETFVKKKRSMFIFNTDRQWIDHFNFGKPLQGHDEFEDCRLTIYRELCVIKRLVIFYLEETDIKEVDSETKPIRKAYLALNMDLIQTYRGFPV